MSQRIKRITIKSPRFRVATALVPLCPYSYGYTKAKGGIPFTSLWQREVGKDFIKFFQTAKVLRISKFNFWWISSPIFV